jgi:hypothetical protein
LLQSSGESERKYCICSRRNSSFDNIWAEVEKMCSLSRKKRNEHNLRMMEDEYGRLYFEVHYIVHFQMKCQFYSSSDLAFIEIFDCWNFVTFGKIFPE